MNYKTFTLLEIFNYLRIQATQEQINFIILNFDNECFFETCVEVGIILTKEQSKIVAQKYLDALEVESEYSGEWLSTTPSKQPQKSYKRYIFDASNWY